MSIDGLILMKGDHLSQIRNILLTFQTSSTERNFQLGSEKVVNLNEAKVSKCSNHLYIVFYKGWTIIVDRYCIFLQTRENYKKWKEWSSTLNTEFFILEQYSVISKSIYCIYDKGQVRRAYCSIDGDISVNTGSPPPIELQLTEGHRRILFHGRPVDENFGVLNECDLFRILKKLTGIDYLHDLYDIITSAGHYFD